MEDNRVRMLMDKFRGVLNEEQAIEVEGMLYNADDSAFNYLIDMPIKKKGVALALSIFLGGVGAGRFYIGDKGIGVLRIIVTFVNLALSAVPGVGTVAYVINLIWYIAEIFICYGRSKKKNYENIIRKLSYAN